MTNNNEKYDPLSVDESAEWMTQKDVARRCHVTVITVRAWITGGRLPAYRVGPKMIRIRRNDVDAMMSPVPTTPWPGATMQSLDDIRRALLALTVSPPSAAAQTAAVPAAEPTLPGPE